MPTPANTPPAPPLPHVSSGTVTRAGDGALTWHADPAEHYAEGTNKNENSVNRLLTQAEADQAAAVPAPRVLIRKSTVNARANDRGKYAALFQLMLNQPVIFGQWFSPDWPNVFADDAGLLQALAAVKSSAADIAYITAPDPAGPA